MPATTTKKPEDQTFDEAFDEFDQQQPTDAAGEPSDPAAPVQDPPAVAAATATPAAPAPSEPEDFLASADERIRAEFQKLREANTQLEHRVRTDVGRLSALQRKLNRFEEAAAAPAPAPAAGNPPAQPAGQPAAAPPTSAQIHAAMKSPEAWAQFENDYPDIAGPLNERFNQLQSQLQAQVQTQVRPLVEARKQEEADAHAEFLAEQEEILTQAFPTWRQDVSGADFNQWLAAQTPLIQQGMASEYASDAIHVLQQYQSAKGGKSTVADLQQRRASRVAQAASGPGVQRAATGRPGIPDNFDAAWDALDRQSATR